MKNNIQLLIYALAIICATILTAIGKFDSKTGMTVITGTLLYVAGRFTPYNGGDEIVK